MPNAPSSSDDWPVGVRRYLTHRLLQRTLEHYGGWQGVLQWLYAGTHRDGISHPYAAPADYWYPMAVEDAAAWQKEREATP